MFAVPCAPFGDEEIVYYLSLEDGRIDTGDFFSFKTRMFPGGVTYCHSHLSVNCISR